MKKLKTRRSIKKRFRITKKGKAKCKRAFKGHLLTGKSRKRKRSLSNRATLNTVESRTIRKMLPYG